MRPEVKEREVPFVAYVKRSDDARGYVRCPRLIGATRLIEYKRKKIRRKEVKK
jgi:hypothetical protein